MPASVTSIKYCVLQDLYKMVCQEKIRKLFTLERKKYNHLLDCLTLAHKSLMIPKKMNYQNKQIHPNGRLQYQNTVSCILYTDSEQLESEMNTILLRIKKNKMLRNRFKQGAKRLIHQIPQNIAERN